jgi:hypothetical protein
MPWVITDSLRLFLKRAIEHDPGSARHRCLLVCGRRQGRGHRQHGDAVDVTG